MTEFKYGDKVESPSGVIWTVVGISPVNNNKIVVARTQKDKRHFTNSFDKRELTPYVEMVKVFTLKELSVNYSADLFPGIKAGDLVIDTNPMGSNRPWFVEEVKEVPKNQVHTAVLSSYIHFSRN